MEPRTVGEQERTPVLEWVPVDGSVVPHKASAAPALRLGRYPWKKWTWAGWWLVLVASSIWKTVDRFQERMTQAPQMAEAGAVERTIEVDGGDLVVVLQPGAWASWLRSEGVTEVRVEGKVQYRVVREAKRKYRLATSSAELTGDDVQVALDATNPGVTRVSVIQGWAEVKARGVEGAARRVGIEGRVVVRYGEGVR